MQWAEGAKVKKGPTRHLFTPLLADMALDKSHEHDFCRDQGGREAKVLPSSKPSNIYKHE